MKKHTLLGTILSAALITAGSMAMAQQSGTGTGSSGGSGAGGAAGPRGTAPIQEQSPSTPGGSGAGTMAPSASPSSPSGSMAAPSTGMSGSSVMAPSEDLVGKDVVNAQGEEIGEISAVMGNQVIVEVGGFLGIGAREVAVDWEKITTTGAGDDLKLQTTLTKAELEAMPEYKK